MSADQAFILSIILEWSAAIGAGCAAVAFLLASRRIMAAIPGPELACTLPMRGEGSGE